MAPPGSQASSSAPAPELLTCTRCGRANPSHRLFCSNCGLGLQVLPGTGDAGLDAPAGALYFHGLLGGLAALAASTALFPALLAALRDSEDLVGSAGRVQFYLWRVVPLLFGLGAACGVAWHARRLRLPRSLAGALIGAAWMVGLGLVLGAWAGEAAVVGACLFSPLAAARGGVGLFAPWTPLRRLAALTAVAIAVSAGLLALRSPDAEAIWLDEKDGRIAVLHAGTVTRLDGLQAAVRLGSAPPGAVGVAWQGGDAVVALRSGTLARVGEQPQVPSPTADSTWRSALRLGERLLVLSGSGLLAADAPWTRPEPLGPAAQGRALTLQLGPAGRSAYVRLDAGALLEVPQSGIPRRLELDVPPLATAVTLDAAGRQACAAVGRRVLCRDLGPHGAWQATDAGLRVFEIRGLCALEHELAVATERGVYVGRGTEQSPYRPVLAGRIDALQACSLGALAVSDGILYVLDGQGRCTARGSIDAN